MMTYEATGADGYAVLTVSGKISADDFNRIGPQIASDIETHGKLKLLEKIEGFTGMEPMAFVRDIQFSLPLVNKISHVALVADAAWIRTATDLFGGLFPGKVKSFEMETEAAARMWLTTAS